MACPSVEPFSLRQILSLEFHFCLRATFEHSDPVDVGTEPGDVFASRLFLPPMEARLPVHVHSAVPLGEVVLDQPAELLDGVG